MRRVLFALMFASTGCFTYTHIETSAPAATDVVRVELTDAGTVAMTPALGASVQLLEGPVLANSVGALEMEVRLLRRRGEGLMTEWPGDHITIPAANIREVEAKTMDRRKTTAAVFGGTALAAVTLYVVSKAKSLFTGDPGKVIIVNIR
jgi:hypothetical protein